MAVLFNKLKCLLKKAITRTEKGDHVDIGYKKMEEVKEEEDEKQCTTPRGYVPIHVLGEEEREFRYLVPMAVVNSPVFVAMLDKYEADMIGHRIGPLSVPCSIVAFECVLLRAVDQKRSR